jgi:hypothetical protein
MLIFLVLAIDGLFCSMRFEVLTTMKVLVLFFWVMMMCGLVDRYQHFGETYCLHRQSWSVVVAPSKLYHISAHDCFQSVSKHILCCFARAPLQTTQLLIKSFLGNKPCQLWIKAQLFGGGDGLWNFGLFSTTDTACCPRRFYRVQSPWKLQVLYTWLLSLLRLISVPLVKFPLLGKDFL